MIARSCGFKGHTLHGAKTTCRQPPVCRRPLRAMQAQLSEFPGLSEEACTFLEANSWARAVAELQHGVHEQIQQQLEPLHVQPTQFAADGVLKEVAPEGRAYLRLMTHAGKGAIRHKFQTITVFPPFGMLYTKTGAHACPEQGTPHLDVEIAGTRESVLLAMFMTPRLSTLRHPAYTSKYYMSIPPAHGNANGHDTLLSLKALHNRMQDRAEKNLGVQVLSTAQQGPSAATQTLLYRHFHSRQLYTRLMAGHGALFTFDSTSSDALSAVKEDVTAFVALWCAWAKADWANGAGPHLPDHQLDECREMTKIWANSFDTDEETGAMEKLIGMEAATRAKKTLNGEASLAGTPWWKDAK